MGLSGPLIWNAFSCRFHLSLMVYFALSCLFSIRKLHETSMKPAPELIFENWSEIQISAVFMRVSWRFYGIFLPFFHGFFLLRKNSLNSVWDLHLNSSSFSKINPESNSSVPLRAGFMEFSCLFVPAENCMKPSSNLHQAFPHFQKLISIPSFFGNNQLF